MSHPWPGYSLRTQRSPYQLFNTAVVRYLHQAWIRKLPSIQSRLSQSHFMAGPGATSSQDPALLFQWVRRILSH